MKKIYINPSIDVLELESEELLIADSLQSEQVNASQALSKERESVDFSDEESIW